MTNFGDLNMSSGRMWAWIIGAAVLIVIAVALYWGNLFGGGTPTAETPAPASTTEAPATTN